MEKINKIVIIFSLPFFLLTGCQKKEPIDNNLIDVYDLSYDERPQYPSVGNGGFESVFHSVENHIEKQLSTKYSYEGKKKIDVTFNIKDNGKTYNIDPYYYSRSGEDVVEGLEDDIIKVIENMIFVPAHKGNKNISCKMNVHFSFGWEPYEYFNIDDLADDKKPKFPDQTNGGYNSVIESISYHLARELRKTYNDFDQWKKYIWVSIYINTLGYVYDVDCSGMDLNNEIKKNITDIIKEMKFIPGYKDNRPVLVKCDIVFHVSDNY